MRGCPPPPSAVWTSMWGCCTTPQVLRWRRGILTGQVCGVGKRCRCCRIDGKRGGGPRWLKDIVNELRFKEGVLLANFHY